MIIPPSDLSIEAYHSSAPAWLSKTSLRDLAEHGPRWWRKAYLDRTIVRPTPGGAVQGLALDCLLTEGPAAFGARFAIRPENFDGRTKAGKDWTERHAGLIPLSAEDGAILNDAAAAVVTHPRWGDIQRCRTQLTCRRHSAGLGLGLQSRPDWLDLERGVLFDCKKTRDLDRFGRQAIDLGFHLQAAVAGWCLAGDEVQLEHAYLVAVEWEHGARCRVYEIPHEVLEAGDRQMRELAAEVADRLKRDDWTDAPPDCEPLAIPDHMLRAMGAA